MSQARTARTRRHRRQTKQTLKHGKSAKPKHQLKSGRTGSVHSSKLKGR